MFLLGSGATLAAAYLAACGKPASAQIAAKEIPVGSAIIVDGVIFAQPKEGEFKAYSQKCPHEGQAITKIDGSTATCTTHYSTFDLATGERTGGPARKPLTEYTVTEEGDLVKAAGK